MKVKSKKAKGKTFLAPLRLCGVFLLLAAAASAQWVKQNVDTQASFRGLSVVNEKVVWASGTGGTVIRTIDGGKTWKVMTVPGAEKLDFRDIEAFDANTAYILSIGNGENSRIYKTTDGGTTWILQFKNTNEKAFYDAIGCWNQRRCIAVADPIDDNFFGFVTTEDGGLTWKVVEQTHKPLDMKGQAAFAASGTCLIVNGYVYLVSGGSKAVVYRSQEENKWFSADTPILKGTPASGIFSIAMLDFKNGVIVGGNYEKPNEAKDNLAFTTDGGATWKLGTGLTGYRSAVAYIDAKTIIAVGTNGTDLSKDAGRTWAKIGSEDLNAVAAKGKSAVWAVGPKGLVVKMK